MVTCTECGNEIESGTQYLAGKYVTRVSSITGAAIQMLVLFWACEHLPAEDAPVRLASKVCIEKFTEKHPGQIEQVLRLMSVYEKDCHQPA